MKPYGRYYWRGERFNGRSIRMLIEAERRYGAKFTYYQGSYNTGVSASAGTHDGGGAVDLWCGRPGDAVRALRNVGWAAWDRTGGPWTPHIHGIAIGDKDLSSGAASQVRDYYNGRDGLAGHNRDPHPRPNPIRVWGKNVGPHKAKPKRVDWFVIRRQLTGRVPTHRWAVKVLQRELQEAGFKPGPADGVAGPRTRRVFAHYRRAKGLGPFQAAARLLRPKYRAVRPARKR